MIKQDRWNRIIHMCKQQSEVSVLELVNTLQASEATIRRDLYQMEELNMITRYHGGAKLNNDQQNEPPMMIKTGTNMNQKHLVARLAASRIKDNQMIYIDAGSSTYEMLDYITAKNITVVTIGIPHIEKLSKNQIRTIVLGGTVRHSTSAITGRTTLDQLEHLFFDVAFVGVNGIHDIMGFTTTNQQEAEVKGKVIQHSKTSYILADSSKFNILCPESYAKLEDAIILSDDIKDFDEDHIRYILTDGTEKLTYVQSSM